ncbi:hypothetical protein GBA52_007897 [Prunus armeniaca]|nr:hypothetical protein GBA52_007897 [Prunus armeniaca]
MACSQLYKTRGLWSWDVVERYMAYNLFGDPIENSTLKGMPEYQVQGNRRKKKRQRKSGSADEVTCVS